MKKAKYIVLSMLLAAAVLLSGCQLALEEKEYSKDKLVGISVKLRGISYVWAGDDYFDRRQPHEPDGALIWLKTDYDENGVPMSGAVYEDDDWFEPVQIGFHVKDEGEEHALETTLYLAEDRLPDDPYLEMEHVYQREDGTLYAIDNGSNYSGHLDGISLKISQSYSATTPDGEKREQSTTIQLNVKYDEVVLSAEAIEMKGTGEEIARHKLTDQEDIWISADTEWILVEETLADGTIRRSAVNGPLNNETFFVRFANEQGVCIRQTYKLRTPGVLSDETRPG